MGLSFLVPAFLAGLVALGIPVLIHLTRRERTAVVEFPSLMFLQKLPYETIHRRRIRHWLLLVLRCVALALVVAAFARPFLDRPTAAAMGRGGREVVILLDRSYSMGYGDRWDRAREAAYRVIDGLGPRDRATLVLFDASAEAVTPATPDRGRLRAAVEAAEVGPGITRYGPALRLARSLLEASGVAQREVVLITDFQRVGWESEDPVRLPPGARLLPVPVADASAGNVAVTSVSFRRETFSGRERVTVSARLANKGGEAVRGVRVALELNGRELRAERVDLEPNGSAAVSFAPFTLSEPGTRGVVRVGEDALTADNAFHFVLSPGVALPVLVLEAGTGSAGRYLDRALAIGGEPGFQVTTRRAGQFRPAELEGRAVVILNDAPFPGGEGRRRLREFVEGGGGLIIVLGERSGGSDALGGLVGAAVGRPAEAWRGRRSAALVSVDYGHPIFEPFQAPRAGDFTSARFFRYRPVTVRQEGARVLARFDDGSPALIEQRVGRGRVLVWASTLDTDWNDLALQPVFLPFVHQLVRHAAGYEPPRAWHTVGEALDLGGRGEVNGGAAEWVAVSPSGERIRLGKGERAALALAEPGFYEIRSVAGGERGQTVAVNVDLAESDLASFDPSELVAAVGSDGGVPPQPGVLEARLTPEERERNQALWWYLLAAAFVLLAVETLVSNRLRRAG